MMNFSINRKGQMLLEAVVALSMLSFSLIGIFTLVSNSIAFNRMSTNEYIAANLAAEGIEIVRNILDTNIIEGEAWNNGVSNGDKEADYDDLTLGVSSNRFIKYDTSTGFYSYDSGSNAVFKRKININNISAEEIRVISTVSWRDRNLSDHSVVLEGHLYNWR